MKEKSEQSKPEANGAASPAVATANGTGPEMAKPATAADKEKPKPEPEAAKPEPAKANGPKDAPPKTPSASEKPKPSFATLGASVSTPPPAGARGESGGGQASSALTLIIAAVLGGAIVAIFQGIGSGGTDTDLTSKLTALEGRLDSAELGGADASVAGGFRTELEELKGRVSTLETQRTARIRPGSVPQDLNDALQRLESTVAEVKGESTRASERLTGRLDNLEAALPKNLREVLDSKAEKPAVTKLQERVVSLENNDVAQDARRAALAIALANLTRASGDSAPFKAELEAVSLLVKDDVVDSLRAYATEGLPSSATLSSMFSGTGRNIVRAYESSKSMGIFGRLWANIIAMLTIRPTGELSGDSPTAIVARAERRLADGDLSTAVEELDKLEDDAASAATGWLDQAKARLDLNRLIGELNTRIIASLKE